jgi:hypothetical protein
LNLRGIWAAAATVSIFWLVVIAKGIAKSQAYTGVITISGSRLWDFAINLPILVAPFSEFP